MFFFLCLLVCGALQLGVPLFAVQPRQLCSKRLLVVGQGLHLGWKDRRDEVLRGRRWNCGVRCCNRPDDLQKRLQIEMGKFGILILKGIGISAILCRDLLHVNALKYLRPENSLHLSNDPSPVLASQSLGIVQPLPCPSARFASWRGTRTRRRGC